MKKLSSCIGQLVCEESSGHPLAKIIDTLFEPHTGKLVGLILDNNMFLYFQDIQAWKIKIYIKSSLLFQDISKQKDIINLLEKNISILGNNIKDTNNLELGYCEDVIFDEKNGIITNLLCRNYLLKIIPLGLLLISHSQILEINSRHILVKSTAIQEAA